MRLGCLPDLFWSICLDLISPLIFLFQTLLPETPKRSQVIQQSPFYLASSGWQAGYKRNPFVVYPRMNTGLSINDPRRTDQEEEGLSIFDPRGKKASLQRYLRYFFWEWLCRCWKCGMMWIFANICAYIHKYICTDAHRKFRWCMAIPNFSCTVWNMAASQLLESYECWSQEWEPPVQHDHQETGRWVERGLGRDVRGGGGGGQGGGGGREGGDKIHEWGNMI